MDLAFFAISMAMFGMTAGSLIVYFNPTFFAPERLFANVIRSGHLPTAGVFCHSCFAMRLGGVSCRRRRRCGVIPHCKSAQSRSLIYTHAID